MYETGIAELDLKVSCPFVLSIGGLSVDHAEITSKYSIKKSILLFLP